MDQGGLAITALHPRRAQWPERAGPPENGGQPAPVARSTRMGAVGDIGLASATSRRKFPVDSVTGRVAVFHAAHELSAGSSAVPARCGQGAPFSADGPGSGGPPERDRPAVDFHRASGVQRGRRRGADAVAPGDQSPPHAGMAHRATGRKQRTPQSPRLVACHDRIADHRLRCLFPDSAAKSRRLVRRHVILVFLDRRPRRRLRRLPINEDRRQVGRRPG